MLIYSLHCLTLLISVVYTVEFQKRGLPHAHILLFLHPEDKITNAQDIDKVICAEIPDPDTDPELYKLVGDSMMHGPCGAMNTSSPCMKQGKCSKHFPKDLQEETSVDEDNGRFVEKNGVKLDNRFVVPYNKTLLLKYGAHINVEWCNQHKSIKYLFKYINKGNDRITAAISQGTEDSCDNVDEIKAYYDCRYI